MIQSKKVERKNSLNIHWGFNILYFVEKTLKSWKKSEKSPDEVSYHYRTRVSEEDEAAKRFYFQFKIALELCRLDKKGEEVKEPDIHTYIHLKTKLRESRWFSNLTPHVFPSRLEF